MSNRKEEADFDIERIKQFVNASKISVDTHNHQLTPFLNQRMNYVTIRKKGLLKRKIRFFCLIFVFSLAAESGINAYLLKNGKFVNDHVQFELMTAEHCLLISIVCNALCSLFIFLLMLPWFLNALFMGFVLIIVIVCSAGNLAVQTEALENIDMSCYSILNTSLWVTFCVFLIILVTFLILIKSWMNLGKKRAEE